MNNGFSNIGVPTLNGLIDINADTIATSTIATSTIVLNGVDVSTQLNQVPINTGNIASLQQITTGITYSATGDLTTIDNNCTITNTKKIKCATVPTTTDDIVNKLYCDNAIASLVNSAPATLDTLNELATALGNDANFSTTVTNAIAGKASLTANQTVSGTNNFSNTSNVYYGSGANLSNINSSTLTTTTLPSTGTYYPIWTNSSTGASSLTPYTTGNISYDRTNNRVTVPNINSVGQLKMTSTDNTIRQIFNTFYNLMDSDTTAGGTYKGRIYTDPSSCYLELTNSSHQFIVTIGAVNVFQIFSTGATFNLPPLCSVAPTTGNMLCNKTYVDSAASSPIGTIVIYSSNTIPAGWLLCNGQLVSKTTYADLFAVIGYTYTLLIAPTTGNFYLPDFTGLYVRGKGLSTTHPGVLPFGQDAIVTSNTTLGQYQMSSPGDHKHFLQTVNTNTQETTGTSTVVSGVSGIPGLILTHKVVSNGVVTTTSNAGSGDTTIYTQDSWGTTQASECRPNNISMNYIIKYGGTITPITAPSFSQATNILNVQNNYATSGIINFQLDDASSVLQTPLSLSSTLNTMNIPLKIQTNLPLTATPSLNINDASSGNAINFIPNAGAGSFNGLTGAGDNLILANGAVGAEYLTLSTWSNTCTGVRIGPSSVLIGAGGTTTIPTNRLDLSSTLTQLTSSGSINLNGSGVLFTNPVSTTTLRIVSDSTSSKNYIQSGASQTSSSITDLIFGSYNNGTSYATFNSEGISLNAGQGSYLFGRNDGALFNAVSTNTLYPIGYSFVYLPTLVTFTSGTALTFTCPTTLAKGVWLVSGWAELSKGTAVFTAASYMRCAVNVVAGTNGSTTMTPTASGVGSQHDIGAASTNATFQHCFATGTVVSVASTCQVSFTNTIVCTVGTATTGVRVTFTKIA